MSFACKDHVLQRQSLKGWNTEQNLVQVRKTQVSQGKIFCLSPRKRSFCGIGPCVSQQKGLQDLQQSTHHLEICSRDIAKPRISKALQAGVDLKPCNQHLPTNPPTHQPTDQPTYPPTHPPANQGCSSKGLDGMPKIVIECSVESQESYAKRVQGACPRQSPEHQPCQLASLQRVEAAASLVGNAA